MLINKCWLVIGGNVDRGQSEMYHLRNQTYWVMDEHARRFKASENSRI